MELMSYIWIGAIIAFALLEVATVNMVSLWFIGGAVAALITQLLGGALWVQIAVFFAVSIALLACLRPFVRKFVTPRKTATNADMALGRQAYLSQTVDNLRGTGALKLDGKEWSARSANGDILPEGTLVTIVKLEGVKLYVEPAQVTADI